MSCTVYVQPRSSYRLRATQKFVKKVIAHKRRELLGCTYTVQGRGFDGPPGRVFNDGPPRPASKQRDTPEVRTSGLRVNGTRQRVRWSSWSCFQRWASQARFETTRHNTILHTAMQCNGTTQYKATQCIATCPTILHTTTQRSTMQRNASQYNTRGRRRPRSDSENPPRPVYNDGSFDMLLHGDPPRPVSAEVLPGFLTRT